MNYAVILASGKGTRIKDNISIPKQFRNINDVPVIIYTIKKMVEVNRFNSIYIVVSENYIEYTNNILQDYFTKEELITIHIICGGEERIDSIENAVKIINYMNNINENDVVVIHDAVRPFITEKIINDSIDNAREYGAVVAAIPVSDTLLISNNHKRVDEIPKRDMYYKGQAPDSFRLKLFIELLAKIPEESKKKITGTSQICTLNNYPIYMIDGDEINFKITTLSDFTIAESIAKEMKIKPNKIRKVISND